MEKQTLRRKTPVETLVERLLTRWLGSKEIADSLKTSKSKPSEGATSVRLSYTVLSFLGSDRNDGAARS